MKSEEMSESNQSDKMHIKSLEGEYDTIIIGAGLSALTCGFILARDKSKVLIIDKNPFIGGTCSSKEVDGFIFDNGPQMFPAFSKDAQLNNFIREFGLLKRINMVRKQKPLKVCIPSGEMEIPSNIDVFKSSLKERYPSEKGIDDFFKTLSKLSHEIYGSRIRKRMTLIRFMMFWMKNPNFVKYHKKTFSSLINRYIEDETLKAYLSAPWIYTGLPPSKVSALELSLMLNHMYEGGVYYPSGGSSELPEVLLFGYKRYGGKILLGSPVDEIIVELVKDIPRVRGVRVGDTIFKTKKVVSTIDARQTFKLTHGMVHKKYNEKLASLQPNVSMVRVMLGIKSGAMKTSAHDTLIFDYDNPDEVYQHILRGEPAFYGITIPPNTENKLAPEGYDVISVRTLIPFHHWKELAEDDDAKHKFIDTLIERAEVEIPNLESRIVSKDVQTPESIIALNSATEGSFFGWKATPRVIQKDILKQSTPISGLLLAGQWTQPGAGVVHAMESGWISAFTIIQMKWLSEEGPSSQQEKNGS